MVRFRFRLPVVAVSLFPRQQTSSGFLQSPSDISIHLEVHSGIDALPDPPPKAEPPIIARIATQPADGGIIVAEPGLRAHDLIAVVGRCKACRWFTSSSPEHGPRIVANLT
jgi:hypothetical protein